MLWINRAGECVWCDAMESGAEEGEKGDHVPGHTWARNLVLGRQLQAQHVVWMGKAVVVLQLLTGTLPAWFYLKRLQISLSTSILTFNLIVLLQAIIYKFMSPNLFANRIDFWRQSCDLPAPLDCSCVGQARNPNVAIFLRRTIRQHFYNTWWFQVSWQFNIQIIAFASESAMNYIWIVRC